MSLPDDPRPQPQPMVTPRIDSKAPKSTTRLGDVHFLYAANDSDGGDAFKQGLAGNAIWKQLPFVVAGNTHRLPDGIWMFGGPRAAEAFIDATVAAVTS